jgi:hypothetical protein
MAAPGPTFGIGVAGRAIGLEVTGFSSSFSFSYERSGLDEAGLRMGLEVGLLEGLVEGFGPREMEEF